MKKVLALTFVWVFLFVTKAGASPLLLLREKLIARGFDPDYINNLFQRSEARFLPQIMPRKLLHDEYKLNYNKFLAPERIARAYNFLNTHRKFLETLEKKFGVQKEVLVAILLVETDLGNYIGRYRTFNVLASMAVSANWEKVKPFLPENISPEEEKRLRNFMLRRAKWAFDELCSLLIWTREQNIDPLAIKGSIFGAFGLPQFVPSSVVSYGVDWNKDGKINLFEIEDAMASMANYLSCHGWKPELSYSQKIKVIKTYNNSQPYAETVLKIAERLKHAYTSRRN